MAVYFGFLTAIYETKHLINSRLILRIGYAFIIGIEHCKSRINIYRFIFIKVIKLVDYRDYIPVIRVNCIGLFAYLNTFGKFPQHYF